MLYLFIIIAILLIALLYTTYKWQDQKHTNLMLFQMFTSVPAEIAYERDTPSKVQLPTAEVLAVDLANEVRTVKDEHFRTEEEFRKYRAEVKAIIQRADNNIAIIPKVNLPQPSDFLDTLEPGKLVILKQKFVYIHSVIDVDTGLVNYYLRLNGGAIKAYTAEELNTYSL